KGELHPLGPVNSGGGGSAYVWVTTRAFADANKDIVKAFAEAVREGNKAVNDDRDLLVRTAAEVLGADAELLEKAAFPVYAETPLTEDDIEFSVEYMNKYDIIEKAAPDAGKLNLPCPVPPSERRHPAPGAWSTGFWRSWSRSSSGTCSPAGPDPPAAFPPHWRAPSPRPAWPAPPPTGRTSPPRSRPR